MGLFSSLNGEQKKVIGLLQLGTFLEYFDLMLYVHMAVLLNELFFPKTDPHTASLLVAFAFCSTYVFRPIGALLFGWVGDNLGRKPTIVIAMAVMSISCIIMATLPTYAQIGIAAAWIVTLCRMAQGMSSMGEVIGAQIYMTESIRRPVAYIAVGLMDVSANLGGLCALGTAFFVTSFSFNWRYVFWAGAVIALVGSVARSRLRETPVFLKMQKQKLREEIENLNLEMDPDGEEINKTWKEPVNVKTLIAFFLTYCGWPLCFYLGFFYFTTTLKEGFGYSPENIISHNFYLQIIMLLSSGFWTLLSYRIHPLNIIKTRGLFGILVMIAMPFLIPNISSPSQLFILQACILSFPLGVTPADVVLISHLPIWHRFTYASFLWALSRAMMYIVTAFGLVYMADFFGHFGIWVIAAPLALSYVYGVFHFEAIERKAKLYPNSLQKNDLKAPLKKTA